MLPFLPCPALLEARPQAPSALESLAYFEQVQGIQGVASPRTEGEARAFFLYSLALVTDWPSAAFKNPQAPLLVAVLGVRNGDPDLEALKKRTAHGRPIQVLVQPELAQLGDCHVVYISAAASGDLPYVLRILRGRPSLIIGEVPALTRLGGMVLCDPAENLLPTEVNIRAAKEVGLSFRSHFLKMVRRVSY